MYRFIRPLLPICTLTARDTPAVPQPFFLLLLYTKKNLIFEMSNHVVRISLFQENIRYLNNFKYRYRKVKVNGVPKTS